MNRRFFIALTLFSIPISNFSLAADDQLTADEIQSLLSGNTIDGDWGGKYMQYYAEDGFTMYVPEGGSNSPGKWRVNSETNMYESWWESTGWTPYGIAKDGDAYVWVDSKGDHYPFSVIEGKQITW